MMHAPTTKHATIRAQQRGIPPLLDELLDRYGQEEYDGHGAIIRYLNKQSIKDMEREWGKRPVARLAEWFDAYKVSTIDGKTITTGHRTHRIWRK